MSIKINSSFWFRIDCRVKRKLKYQLVRIGYLLTFCFLVTACSSISIKNVERKRIVELASSIYESRDDLGFEVTHERLSELLWSQDLLPYEKYNIYRRLGYLEYEFGKKERAALFFEQASNQDVAKYFKVVALRDAIDISWSANDNFRNASRFKELILNQGVELEPQRHVPAFVALTLAGECSLVKIIYEDSIRRSIDEKFLPPQLISKMASECAIELN